MRRFTDAAGNHWDVIVGRESWGAHVALFVPLGEGPVRQAVLGAISADRAGAELDDIDETAMRVLFDRSMEKADT